MFNLSVAVSNPDMSTSWQLLRNVGSWKAGGWTQDSSTSLSFYGVVSVADDRALDMVPEGDRVKGGMMFHSVSEMFVTNEASMGTSDVIVWQGEQYRILNVARYGHFGYYRAFAVRMRGN